MVNEMEEANATEVKQLQAAGHDCQCNIHPNLSHFTSLNRNQRRSRLLCCFDPSQLCQYYYCQVRKGVTCCIPSDLPRSFTSCRMKVMESV